MIRIDREILNQYSDVLARVKLLREQVDKLEVQKEKMDKQGYYETDYVTKGRKGKKSLGTIIIGGFPHPKYEELSKQLENRQKKLEAEEQELLNLITEVEEYIQIITEVEIRNIMTLYYVEDLNWVQVAHRMNGAYGKRKEYTADSCRCKQERFLEKF